VPPFTNVGISWVLLVASPAIPLLGVLSRSQNEGWVAGGNRLMSQMWAGYMNIHNQQYWVFTLLMKKLPFLLKPWTDTISTHY